MKEVKDTMKEVLTAVAPVTALVLLIQLTIAKTPPAVIGQFVAGAIFVLVGLFLFLLGVNIGLLPIGRTIGAELPSKGSIYFFFIVSLLLGVAVTIADPDVMVLANQVAAVSEAAIGRSLLILTVAVGMGFFVAVAMLRIVLGVPIQYLFAGGYALLMLLSLFAPADFIPISFDSGAVATGPLIVPFVMSLGLGTASVLQGRSPLRDGFGLMGLAALGPVLAVMLLGVIYS
ncbi:MAG: DUF1538 domain-containing protein [Firmicutes bacterium]|nr:DUF1538 domain-containing protein [Bacillota bacterium]